MQAKYYEVSAMKKTSNGMDILEAEYSRHED